MCAEAKDDNAKRERIEENFIVGEMERVFTSVGCWSLSKT